MLLVCQGRWLNFHTHFDGFSEDIIRKFKAPWKTKNFVKSLWNPCKNHEKEWGKNLPFIGQGLWIRRNFNPSWILVLQVVGREENSPFQILIENFPYLSIILSFTKIRFIRWIFFQRYNQSSNNILKAKK